MSNKAYISFSAEINRKTTESLIAQVAQLVNEGVTEIYLLLATPGGQVDCGINLYTVLTGMPATLTTHNVGNVDSIGNAVFLAGTHRYATQNSTFMFHGVGYDINRSSRLEEKNVREALRGILREQARIGSIIRDRTELSEKQVKGLFRTAQTKDATFAVGAGIIDDIRDVEISPGCPVYALVFDR